MVQPRRRRLPASRLQRLSLVRPVPCHHVCAPLASPAQRPRPAPPARSPTASFSRPCHAHCSLGLLRPWPCGARPSAARLLPAHPSTMPWPSNLTNAEIYSLQSSRNPTPRGSSFNHTDFYSMAGRSSNFGTADEFGVRTSTTPWPSNYEDDAPKPKYQYQLDSWDLLNGFLTTAKGFV